MSSHFHRGGSSHLALSPFPPFLRVLCIVIFLRYRLSDLGLPFAPSAAWIEDEVLCLFPGGKRWGRNMKEQTPAKTVSLSLSLFSFSPFILTRPRKWWLSSGREIGRCQYCDSSGPRTKNRQRNGWGTKVFLLGLSFENIYGYLLSYIIIPIPQRYKDSSD